jgi:bacterioferritin-associated ferredoxin
MVRIIDYIEPMIVCICNRITECELRKAARSGAPTAETAYASLGCEVQCGCCLDYAEDLIEEERADLLKVDAVAA